MVELKEAQKNIQIIEERSINPERKAVTKEQEVARAKQTYELIFARVESLMGEVEETRNDDNLLVVEMWERDLGIDLSELKEKIKIVSSASSIERARRLIQNDKLDPRLLPTRVGVIIHRKIKQEALEKYYGKESEILREWREDTFIIK